MASQERLNAAKAWADAQIGKRYVLGSFGSTFDCSTFMSGIATYIRDGSPKRWFTTHPFHSGGREPVAGWVRDLQAPFMIGITADGIGHTGGTLLGTHYEATPPRLVRGSAARGANHRMYRYVYGFRPSLLDGSGGGSISTYPFVANASNPSAKPLQRALKAAGFMSKSVAESDNYGPATQDAVAKFHNAHTAYRSPGVSRDVQIGTRGWAFLQTLAGGLPSTPPPVTPPPASSDPYASALPRPNQSSPSAKPLQRALKSKGYMENSIVESDNYGPATQSAVARFHDLNLQFKSPGVTRDIAIGRNGWNYLRSSSGGGSSTPTPPPATSNPTPAPTADPYRNGLPRSGQSSPSAKALQAELKRVGYMANGVAASDNYGPETQASVAEFHRHNPSFSSAGVSFDRQLGPRGWAHLRSMRAGSGRAVSSATRNAAGGSSAPSSGGGSSSGRPSSPVPGYRVTYAYGIRNSGYAAGYHTGDDYAAPTGTPVVSVVSGTVAWSNTSGGSYGTWIGIRGDNGRDYVYCHLSARSVNAGQRVTAGQRIGSVGSTGNSTGPHLHFEDRPRGGGYGQVRKPSW